MPCALVLLRVIENHGSRRMSAALGRSAGSNTRILLNSATRASTSSSDEQTLRRDARCSCHKALVILRVMPVQALAPGAKHLVTKELTAGVERIHGGIGVPRRRYGTYEFDHLGKLVTPARKELLAS